MQQDFSGAEERLCQSMVAGKPKLPSSLAVV